MTVVNGVNAAGLTTHAHPAANAGAIFRVAIAMGKFQGAMRTALPTGERRTKIVASPAGESR